MAIEAPVAEKLEIGVVRILPPAKEDFVATGLRYLGPFIEACAQVMKVDGALRDWEKDFGRMRGEYVHNIYPYLISREDRSDLMNQLSQSSPLAQSVEGLWIESGRISRRLLRALETAV